MDRGEKIMLVAIGLASLALVINVVEVWPVLAAHKAFTWLPFALTSISVLFVVLDLCTKVRKSSQLRWREALQVALAFLFNWISIFFLIGMIGQH